MPLLTTGATFQTNDRPDLPCPHPGAVRFPVQDRSNRNRAASGADALHRAHNQGNPDTYFLRAGSIPLRGGGDATSLVCRRPCTLPGRIGPYGVVPVRAALVEPGYGPGFLGLVLGGVGAGDFNNS